MNQLTGNAAKAIWIIATSLLLPSCVESYAEGRAEESEYSPYARQDFPDNLYWGDTHVHTNLSSDAYGMNAELTPAAAYRFAKGEVVLSNTGQPARLSRPLDFLVVADHAEYLGVSAMLDTPPENLARSEIGQRWLKLNTAKDKLPILLDGAYTNLGRVSYSHDPEVYRSTWMQVANAADKNNDPGKFTAFIGFEWSAMPDGNNLHRNVIFRGDATTVKDIVPFSSLDSRNPEELWKFLETYENSTGGRVMAIPHNGNISNGLMFRDRTYADDPLTRADAETRIRWEPVIEVTQMKGDSETHPVLSPDDEFADFETWDTGNFNMPQDPKQNSMLQYEYARSTLINGLVSEDKLGVNPFKVGMIGSTDTHTALAAVEENNYFGKFATNEPSKGRADNDMMRTYRYVASGYAAVWATENTREALFDAMQRREVYASTGPRMMVRFFGGWDFGPQDALRPDYAAVGYGRGVPMGGDLTAASDGGAPRFLVVASKDPMGANLDRVQIVKGWLEKDGTTGEKVYDVALSDGRSADRNNGGVTPVGTTVDVVTASYTNTIGATQLATVWQDPEFDADQRAFYYVRVLEIPTPRWTTYDSAFYGTLLSDKVPREIQERAYTSPIWYTP